MQLRKRRGVRFAGLALAVGLVAGGTGAAFAPAASAISLPSCSTVDPGTAPNFVNSQHCWYNLTTGNAGYLGADDNHTHYRYVTTDLFNTPQLVDLNGTSKQGVVGDELCDPNNHAYGAGGWAAEIGLFGNGGTAGHSKNTVFYAAGFWASGAPDPCVNNAPLVPVPDATTNCPPGGHGSVIGFSGSTSHPVFCGSFSDETADPDGLIGVGDHLQNLAVYYDWNTHDSNYHRVSFGYCDTTTGICGQAYSPKATPVTVHLWEFGVGAFSAAQQLTTLSTSNPVDTFDNDFVTCYSCGSQTNIINVQPVNQFGAGGLEEAETANSSGQVTMGPANQLTTSGFPIYNGSTSI